jgi:hypothetical protein
MSVTDDVNETGIPWLTDPQRDFLAHLLTLTIQRQLKPERSYERVEAALADLAADGEVTMRADDDNVWVFVHGESIVHAARDWLEWAAQRWVAADSN